MIADIHKEICNAVEIILNKRLAEIDKNQTITGEVISCLNEAQGLYRVKSQDSYFKAYATDITNVFSPGDVVDVVISNDVNRTKTISSPTNSSTSFLPIISPLDKMIQTSKNLFEDENEYSIGKALNSYSIKLYEKDDKFNNIDYGLQENDYFVIESLIDTSKLKGLEGKVDFGFKITVDVFKNLYDVRLRNSDYKVEQYCGEVKDNTYYYGQKEFYLTVADMSGNPFVYDEEKRIYKVFDVSKNLIYRLNCIELYINNFSTTDNYKVTFKNVKFYSAKKYKEDMQTSYCLKVNSDLYSYFSRENLEQDKITLAADLYILGRKVNFSNTDASSTIYWFMQDDSVGLESEYYSAYGGVGWRCLNNKLTRADGFTWVNGKDTLTLSLDELGIKTKFKTVVHYGDSREISVAAYYEVENIDYRADNGYGQYCIKSYKGDELSNRFSDMPMFVIGIADIKEFKRNQVITFDDDRTLKFEIKDSSAIVGNYKYYWSKSDLNGLCSLIESNGNSIVVSQDDFNNYCYIGCTIKDNNKIITSDSIKMTIE